MSTIPNGVLACVEKRFAIRAMDADTFIEQHASGTLRKNKRLGMAWKAQYLEERTAFEFGWEFESVPRSRVTFGVAYTEGDAKSVTEAGWHADRIISLSIFPGDHYKVGYVMVEYQEGTRREGIGIVCETDAPFVPEGYVVFAILAEFDVPNQEWHPAVNPC